jgi:hypothetical protein
MRSFILLASVAVMVLFVCGCGESAAVRQAPGETGHATLRLEVPPAPAQAPAGKQGAEPEKQVAGYAKITVDVELNGLVKDFQLKVSEPGSAETDTWVLDTQQDQKLTDLLKRLDGKVVIVTGRSPIHFRGPGGRPDDRQVNPVSGVQRPGFFAGKDERYIDWTRKVLVADIKEVGKD